MTITYSMIIHICSSIHNSDLHTAQQVSTCLVKTSNWMRPTYLMWTPSVEPIDLFMVRTYRYATWWIRNRLSILICGCCRTQPIGDNNINDDEHTTPCLGDLLFNGSYWTILAKSFHTHLCRVNNLYLPIVSSCGQLKHKRVVLFLLTSQPIGILYKVPNHLLSLQLVVLGFVPPFR